MKKGFLLLSVLFVLSCTKTQLNETAQEVSMVVGDITMNRFIDSLMNEMTLQEKLGQLNLPSSGDITTGQSKSSNVAENIRQGKVGGLFNIKGVDKIREVQRIAVEESRLGIPLIFAMDVIHGYESTFPIPLGLTSSWNTELIKQSAQVAADEATADGINWTFSPMTDISLDPRWGRISEGSGEDPFLGGEVARAMVHGYQGDDLSKANTMLACVKHFALYGASEAGRDYNTVDMSRLRMYNQYFPPYKAAIDAGVGTVMASFNVVDGIPATGNEWLMTEVLRNQWGFNGFVVSDYTGIEEMIDHGMGDLQYSSQLALKAGVDMDMVSAGFLNTLEPSLTQGIVNESEIDESVRLILEAKYKLGLFEDPYRYTDTARAQQTVYNQENRDFARQIASESFVLLKNNNDILPLQKSGKIALVGPLADAAVQMAGTWSVATVQNRSIPVVEGLRAAVGDQAEILYAKGSNFDYDLAFEKRITMFGKEVPRDNRTDEELLAEAVAIANQSDVIVAAIGEASESSGESSSVTNLQIPESQRVLLNALLETGKPVVMVLFTGRPLAIVEENEKVPAILNVWFPGSEGGHAIADVLFGDVNPSGKLPATFPRNVGQVPIYYNYFNTGRPLSKQKTEDCEFEKFVTNYLDVCNTPLYPFGYGLSYTTFEYGPVRLSNTSMSDTGSITASVEVKNTGDYAGKEVVQLYLRDMVGSISRPVKELKGFQKIHLEEGESKTVTFSIDNEMLKFYNSMLEFDSEPGEFQVFIGTSSAVDTFQTFTLTN